MSGIDEIRKRHDRLEKDLQNPLGPPLVGRRIEHQDRATLLAKVDELEAELKEKQTAANARLIASLSNDERKLLKLIVGERE